MWQNPKFEPNHPKPNMFCTKHLINYIPYVIGRHHFHMCFVQMMWIDVLIGSDRAETSLNLFSTCSWEHGLHQSHYDVWNYSVTPSSI